MKKRVLYYVDSSGRIPVWDYLTGLPPAERNKCLEYIAYLEEMGETVRRPVGDYLGGNLYELRPKQIRLFYFFLSRDSAVLLHAFRKTTRALPQREIDKANARMADFSIRFERGEIQTGE